MAQPGSATVWGTGGRVFESRLPDKKNSFGCFFVEVRMRPTRGLADERDVDFGDGFGFDADEHTLHVGVLLHEV